MRHTVWLMFATFLLLLSCGDFSVIPSSFAAPQHREQPQPQDRTLEKMQQQAEKQRNEKRQSDLQRDADQLYKLAGELKKSVDSTNEHVLSLEVLRKTEEIQKLAKSVHDKMKAEGYGSTVQ